MIPSLAPASGHPKNRYQEILAEMTNDTHMIRAGRVHVTDRCVHVGLGAKAQRQPHVELVRDAGGIRSIRVTCRCGEVLCLDLDYASKAA